MSHFAEPNKGFTLKNLVCKGWKLPNDLPADFLIPLDVVKSKFGVDCQVKAYSKLSWRGRTLSTAYLAYKTHGLCALGIVLFHFPPH